MPPASTRSIPHQRTRRDHARETAEDYVEAIAELAGERGHCRVGELALRFGVSHVTVTRTIRRLQEAGLVRTAPHRPIELTRKGQRLAGEARRKHEIVLGFLVAIGVDPQTASIDAEGIEHHVSRETLECFRQLAAGGGEPLSPPPLKPAKRAASRRHSCR